MFNTWEMGNDIARSCPTVFRFLIPGLVDTHLHAPQYTIAGTGTDLPLLDWLNKVMRAHQFDSSASIHSLRRPSILTLTLQQTCSQN